MTDRAKPANSAWVEKRTTGVTIDGIYFPANACPTCEKWHPPYKAGVPTEYADLYCWGDCADDFVPDVGRAGDVAGIFPPDSGS